jgi:hypothetical protein
MPRPAHGVFPSVYFAKTNQIHSVETIMLSWDKLNIMRRFAIGLDSITGNEKQLEGATGVGNVGTTEKGKVFQGLGIA